MGKALGWEPFKLICEIMTFLSQMDESQGNINIEKQFFGVLK